MLLEAMHLGNLAKKMLKIKAEVKVYLKMKS